MGSRKQKFSKKKFKLLEVASGLILKKGFAATSMNDIATQMGFNKAALYYYCRSKEDIALEILKLIHARVETIFSEAEETCGSGLEMLRYFFQNYVQLMTTPMGAAAVQLASLRYSEVLEKRSTELFKAVDNRVKGYIIEGQADGTIAKLNVRWSDFVLFGALHSIPRWYSDQGDLTPEQIAEVLFETLLNGLSPR